MAAIVWDATGERIFETGVDRGVLYPIDSATGTYPAGVAWNGLTGVTESPSGAESNPQYADNIKYLDLLSLEEFGLTIEAFTYPDEFAECDGSVEAQPGVRLGQQARKTFGLSFRTRVGNDVDGDQLGYKIHLVYGCKAQPSERAFATVNDSPEALNMSWTVTTTPVNVSDTIRPTSLIVVDSTKVDAGLLAAFEAVLYGTNGTPGTTARLPLPAEVITLLTDV